MGTPFQPTPMQAPGGFSQPQQQQGGQPTQQNKAVTVTDWNQVPDGASSRLDPTDDPWAFSAPPPMGKYRLKLFLPKDGVTVKVNEDGPMFMCNMECRIQHEDSKINNFPVFDFVSTLIGRGKQMSTMAGILRNAGVLTQAADATPKQIAQAFSELLKREPVLWAYCDWEGRVQDGEDRKGNPNWVTKFSSMVDFPPKQGGQQGEKEHIVKVTLRNGGYAEVRAQLRVQVWGTTQDVAVPHQPVAIQPGFGPAPGFAAAPVAAPAAPAGFAPAPQAQPAPAPAQGSPFAQAAPQAQQAPFGQPAQAQPTNAAPQPTNAVAQPAQGDLSSLLRG